MRDYIFSLDGKWTLTFTHPLDGKQYCIEASVPGNVEIELQREGLIGDYWPVDSVRATEWLSRVDDWTYQTTFDAPDMGGEYIPELVFEGIDTIAEITLNGQRILDVRSMFCEHSARVADILRPKGNVLAVVIRSADLYARSLDYDEFAISRENTWYKSQTYLRKARHEWGWDNAPRLFTAGIWRSVSLRLLSTVRFLDVYPYTRRLDDAHCLLGVNWALETPDADIRDYTGTLTMRFQGETAYEQAFDLEFTRGCIRFELDRSTAMLWWPRGFGDPNLYDLELSVRKNGAPLATWTGKWGIRDIRLLRTDNLSEQDVGDFGFIVNGERVFVKGTNWKPLDALHSRAKERVVPALKLACDLGCNMIRVWGGGVYEDHEFFDYCDAHGLMVWQDFMFACEFAPRDAWFQDVVFEETVKVIKKLRNHCSLAVWCGDNENDQLTFPLTPDRAAPRNILPSDGVISRRTLREAVLRYDPYRDYVPSSPYFSDLVANDLYAPEKSGLHPPELHLYPKTMNFARALRATAFRFVGETGPIIVNAVSQTPSIIERELPRARRLWDQPLAEGKRNLLMHQLDDYFVSWRQEGKELVEQIFGRDFTVEQWDDYALAINYVCACLFKDVIEYCRAHKWQKTGVLWWSLIDMWPQGFNYSVVDYDFHKKPPYYWIRQSQQDFCLMIVRDEEGGEPALYAANETLRRHSGSYSVSVLLPGGDKRIIASGHYDEKPNVNRMLQRMPDADESALWLIEWNEEASCFNHFIAGKEYPSYEILRDWIKYLDKLFQS